MKLPRFTATTPPPRETGIARAQDIGALTNVGDAQFRALEGAGRAAQDAAGVGFKAYMSRQALDDKIATTEANIKAQDAVRLGVDAFMGYDVNAGQPLSPDVKDYWNGDKLNAFDTKAKDEFNANTYSEYKGRIISLSKAIKNKTTREVWVAESLTEGATIFKKASNAKHQEHQEITILGYAKTAAGNGDMELSDQWIDIAERHGLIGPKKAASERLKNKEFSIKELVTQYYRNGWYKNARQALEASSLSQQDKADLESEINSDEKASMLEFEKGINDKLVAIDNAPDMTQADFNDQAAQVKETILANPNIDGTRKRKMLADLDKWKRGTNEIDYARILSLNQEMDAAQRSGIVDPTIKDRINRANIEGAFGGRHRGGQTTYGTAIRRFDKLQFDERTQAITPITRAFERENADDPELIFLFHQTKNKIMAENPDMTSRELFVKMSGISESYGIMPPKEISRRMKEEATIIMVSPDGETGYVPVSKKQLFLDNGYTVK